MGELIDIGKVDDANVDSTQPLWEVVIGNYRYVLFGMNKVQVYKGDDEAPAYEISNHSCSCPGDRYNAKACKHRQAVSFVGDGSSGTPSMTEPGVTEKPRRNRPSPSDLDKFL